MKDKLKKFIEDLVDASLLLLVILGVIGLFAFLYWIDHIRFIY